MSPIFRNLRQILIICFSVSGIQAYSAGLEGFFQSLEYGRPVLGVKIPFSWIDPSWKEGTIEIAEATIEPGGPGIWKLATQPDLVLRGVSISGPRDQVEAALRSLGPKGIYFVKIVSFRYIDPKRSEAVDLRKVEIRTHKVTVQGEALNRVQQKLITEIFGKKVEIQPKVQ